jgi:hypothetical protein
MATCNYFGCTTTTEAARVESSSVRAASRTHLSIVENKDARVIKRIRKVDGPVRVDQV